MEKKIQKSEVNRLALEYVKKIYTIRQKMPDHEKYNLTNHLEKAVS